MSLRSRFLTSAACLAVLIALFIVGWLTSPQKRAARAAGKPLLPVGSGLEITGVELQRPGAAPLFLRAREGRWEAETGGGALPASAERVRVLAGRLAGLQRGALVTRDPARAQELGLGPEEARRLVLHLAGRPDLMLEVGKRAPSGEEDYIRLQGEPGVYLVRGNLSVLLAQDAAYWYDLHPLPPEVRGETIDRITVRGSVGLSSSVLRGDYTIERMAEEKGGGWRIGGAPADPDRAEAMAASLANLEGEDFLEARVAGSGARAAAATEHAPLEIELSTLEGNGYLLRVRAGPEPGLAQVTAGGLPPTYLVREEALRRAVRPAAELREAR